MRIAYATIDEVNHALAARMALRLGATVTPFHPEAVRPNGQCDAVLYDLDRVSPDRRLAVLEEILSGSPSCPTAVHGYSISEEQAHEIRLRGIVVASRLRPGLLRRLCRAAPRGARHRRLRRVPMGPHDPGIGPCSPGARLGPASDHHRGTDDRPPTKAQAARRCRARNTMTQPIPSESCGPGRRRDDNGASEVLPALPDPLGRLVDLWRSNERLLAQLRTSRDELKQVRGYLAEPGCNPALGGAYRDRLRIKRAGLRALLRANRTEALQVLGAIEQRPAAGTVARAS